VDTTLVMLVHKKQPAEMLLRWGSYKLHHWKQHHAISSQWWVGIQNVILLDLLGNSEIYKYPIGNSKKI